MPINRPVVKAIFCRPASSMVRRRSAGALSGARQWAAPFMAQARAGRSQHQAEADVTGPAQGGSRSSADPSGRDWHAAVESCLRAGPARSWLPGNPVSAFGNLAELRQEFSRFGKHALWLIAQAEQSFLAPLSCARFGDGEHLIRRHISRAAGHWVGTEGAVAAIVAAEMGERNEDLFRIADGPPF